VRIDHAVRLYDIFAEHVKSDHGFVIIASTLCLGDGALPTAFTDG
jgi:hypothetical protein